MMNCELLAVCSALGYLEGDVYFKEEDCIDSVKCLIKYLHNEDSTRDIRTQLGAAHILQNDLLPILTQYADDQDLFSCVLRLVINLTQPALLCFNGKVPKDTVMHYHFLNVVSYNQDYKEAFGKDEQVWNVLKKKICSILQVNWEDRKPEDSLLVERCLVLLRNILHTPATSEDFRKTNQEMSSQDSLIWKIHSSDLDDLILYMVGSNDEQQWMLHLIEIICLILKEQNAVQLAEVDGSTSKAREREGDQLLAMRKTEDTRRKIARAKLTSRHSRFGGTYVARGTKALSDDNDVILHRSLQHCQAITFDEGKSPVKKARNRRAIIEEVIERHSSRGVRKILNSFCKGFLERGYNLCMRITKDRLQRESAQDHDETFYFWMMSFFLKFNRTSDFKVRYVSETLNLNTLHFIETNLFNYYELMLNDKHDAQAWSRRLHLALRCYHEFLMSVQLMSHSEDLHMQQSAKVLLNNIFYVVEHREILVVILRKFNERKQCRAFLRDAVLTTHLFLKMFENFCRDGTVVVEKKVKARKPRRKKATKKKENEGTTTKVWSKEERETKWEEISDDVTQHLQTLDRATLEVQSVFDPSSDLTESEQQQIALLVIQNFLLENKVDEATKYYLNARNIWPETGIFGSTGYNNEEEMNDLREIVLADLSSVAKLQTSTTEAGDGDDENMDTEAEKADEEEEVAASRLQRTKREIEFDYEDYIKKFADSNVIHAYATLLQSYDSNGQHLNHCIVKMLHRIAYQLKMYGFLFQASIFRVFQQIHSASKFDQSYREIVALGNWVLRKFFDVFQRNPVAVAELLFWKTNALQCFEITNGYGTTTKKKKNMKSPWSTTEIEELKRLFDEHKSKLEQGGLLDAILSDIDDENRTRIDVKSQLLQLGLVEDANLLKGNRGPGVWRPEDIEELKELYNDHKSDSDPINQIQFMMRIKRPRNKLIDKIMSLGLAPDR